MATRCKFVCNSVTKRAGGYAFGNFVYDAEFHVVYGDSEENKKFFAATPTGTLKVGVLRDDQFEPGKSYYLDIVAVE